MPAGSVWTTATRSRDEVDEQALGDHLASPEGLTARSNTFDERQVLQEFAAAAGQGALVGEIRAQAERFAARGDVLATARGEMTTAELVALRAPADRSRGRPCRRGDRHRRFLARRACDRRGRPSAHRRAGRGRANGGQLRARSERHPGARRDRQDLHRRRAARGLRERGPSRCSASRRRAAPHASSPRRPGSRRARWTDCCSTSMSWATSCPRDAYSFSTRRGWPPPGPARDCWRQPSRRGAKVIAIGDPGQLASVQAGGWLAAVGRRARGPSPH